MKKLTVGILAHVDAGKTTLSEGLLYTSGAIRHFGRVDHQDTFLDNNDLERERGITIFSKQAVFTHNDTQITLLDTPGHVDFSSEMERTLQVIDYAVLVISAGEAIQSHTRTVWQLLEQHAIPVFLFINKMDLPSADRQAVFSQLLGEFGDGFVDFSVNEDTDFYESLAMCDEDALARFLEDGKLTDIDVCALIHRRQVFPCFFGSALRLDGVDSFLDKFTRFTVSGIYTHDFGATIYKIGHDAQGKRLTYMKITGGVLRVKDTLHGTDQNGEQWQEKADQIRIYSGAKFMSSDEAEAGTVCAVLGLTKTYPGQGLGVQPISVAPVLEPVLNYQVIIPEDVDPHVAMEKFHRLEEEDPQLKFIWSERLHEIHVKLMGEIQLEILRHIIHERFGMDVTFGTGNIIYKETIAAPVEGIGHFEPLRHYAEVHLLIEPMPRGSGLHFRSICSEDVLARSWQRLILTHLYERDHLGVLTGSQMTDVCYTLIAGRAHLKHTEGGDFRQATYRAVRQGLMQAQSILLEPFYDFRIELPIDALGRAINDIDKMNGRCNAPQLNGDTCILTGAAPVAAMRGYAREVTAYSKGRGKFSCALRGYEPCKNSDSIIKRIGYDPERDIENTPDSVFCAHGAGFVVKWDHVRQYMHIDTGLRFGDDSPIPVLDAEPRKQHSGIRYSGSLREDKELEAIFERTYGPIKSGHYFDVKPIVQERADERFKLMDLGQDYLLVDGYNILFAWDELKKLARENLDAARHLLMDILSNYQGYKNCVVILVYDAYKVQRSINEVERYHNIYVVYTKEAETADMYIEKATYEIGRNKRVRVATSDGLEQLIILGHGAQRISARAFHEEVDQANISIRQIIDKINAQ